jgi:putative endonuclease
MTIKRDFSTANEQRAAQFLQNKGYAILEMNWRCKYGELDIIAQQGERIVFVEVRSRRADSTDAAFESVNRQKQAKLIKAAYHYLDAHQIPDADWRIDVIGIAITRAGKLLIEHAEDALG